MALTAETIKESLQKETLNLKGKKITDADIPEIVKFIKENKGQVEMLNLADNDITDEGVAALKDIEVNTLFLQGNKLTEKGAKELIENQNLEVLNLRGCQLSPQTVDIVKKAGHLESFAYGENELITPAEYLKQQMQAQAQKIKDVQQKSIDDTNLLHPDETIDTNQMDGMFAEKMDERFKREAFENSGYNNCLVELNKKANQLDKLGLAEGAKEVRELSIRLVNLKEDLISGKLDASEFLDHSAKQISRLDSASLKGNNLISEVKVIIQNAINQIKGLLGMDKVEHTSKIKDKTTVSAVSVGSLFQKHEAQATQKKDDEPAPPRTEP